MSQRLKIVFAVVAVLVVALVLALTLSWESPALSRAVLGALSGPDLQIEAGSVRLSALRGVLLKEVRMKARLEGGKAEVTAEQLRLSHRFWRLLAGEVAVDELVFVKPVAAVVWDAPAKPVKKGGKAPVAAQAPPPPPAEPATTGGGLAFAMSVRRLALEDATLVMAEEGTPGEMVRFEGLAIELGDLAVDPAAPSMLTGARAEGTVEARLLAASGVVAQGVTGSLSLGEGHLKVIELALPTDFGTIAIPELDLDLGRDPYFFALHGGGDPLLTAKLLGAASGFGNSRLEFAVTGDGSPKGGPRGQGALAVAGGKLGDMPLLAGLEALLAGTELVGRPYSPFTVQFRLDDGDKVTLAPFAIEAGNLRLTAYGRVDLEGPLDLHLEISLPREDVTVKEIPREALEALTDVDNRVKLPILVAGTLDQPAIRFDSRAWAGLAGRRLVSEALKRLFN